MLKMPACGCWISGAGETVWMCVCARGVCASGLLGRDELHTQGICSSAPRHAEITNVYQWILLSRAEACASWSSISLSSRPHGSSQHVLHCLPGLFG